MCVVISESDTVSPAFCFAVCVVDIVSDVWVLGTFWDSNLMVFYRVRSTPYPFLQSFFALAVCNLTAAQMTYTAYFVNMYAEHWTPSQKIALFLAVFPLAQVCVRVCVSACVCVGLSVCVCHCRPFGFCSFCAYLCVLTFY